MPIPVFWLLGLVAIGFVTFLFNRSIVIKTTKDQETSSSVVGWGAVMATIWIVVRGLVVLLSYTDKGLC